MYYILSRSYLIQQSQHIQQCNKFNCLIWFNSLISCNSHTYPKVQQSQWSYLILHSHLIKHSHTFNSVTNSTVLSRFTFSSISKVYQYTSFIWFHSLISFKVPHIKKCNKANGLISFYILIFFNSPTYSTVSQIQLYYILSRSYLIQQSQHIQQCNKFNSLIWFNSLISCNSPTYPKVQQSQWSYLVYILISLNSPTHSKVSHIQQCHKFNCIISFYILFYFNSV